MLLLIIALIIGATVVLVTMPTKRGLDIAGGTRIVLKAMVKKLPPDKQKGWRADKDMLSVVRILTQRVNGGGVSEALIQRKGTDQVIVEIPDVKVEQRDQIVNILQSTAQLEFRHLYMAHQAGADKVRPAASKYTVQSTTDSKTGEETNIVVDDATGIDVTKQALADSKLIVSGSEILPVCKADKDPNRLGATVVNIEFTEKGKTAFGNFTKRNRYEVLAIVLDGKILSAPIIQDAILSGKAVISGNFTPTSGQQLANIINAGALPVPLDIVASSTVEATLGKTSVDQSIMAGIWGIVAVVGFMIFYYLLPGLIADIALVIYALLSMAAFKLMGVAFTLPGIAAYILSIGMAVDANILIFERLKEELRSGKTLRAAIDTGFSRAFTSIFDSNACTAITCIVLLWLGTGPVRGFAAILLVGVLISMFTAITATRTLLHLIVNTSLGEKAWLFGIGRQWVTGKTGKRVDIVGKMKLWFALSLLIIIPGCYYWFGTHGLKPGIDFKGGTMIQAEFQQPKTTSEVQGIMSKVGFGYADNVIQKSTTNKDMVYIRTKVMDQAQQRDLRHAIENAGGRVEATDAVSATISKEIYGNAIKAVLIASLAIVLYLSGRFAIGGFANGFRFGACAILATLHDVLVIIGTFAILGHFLHWEVDGLFVTAVLTIIGFSTHDTIVIFDRIRENLRHRVKGEAFDELVNKSILQSLARSINTSFTVLLTLTAMYFFGAENIRHFIVALLIGVVTGTYSSIFNASQLLVLWDRLANKSKGTAPRELKPLVAVSGGIGSSNSADTGDVKAAAEKAKAKKKIKKRF